jgi:hypothetical protein
MADYDVEICSAGNMGGISVKEIKLTPVDHCGDS